MCIGWFGCCLQLYSFFGFKGLILKPNFYFIMISTQDFDFFSCTSVNVHYMCIAVIYIM